MFQLWNLQNKSNLMSGVWDVNEKEPDWWVRFPPTLCYITSSDM